MSAEALTTNIFIPLLLPVFLSIRIFGALSLLFMLITTNALVPIKSIMSSSATMASASASDECTALIRSMHLPKMSTAHPKHYFWRSDDTLCPGHLRQSFTQSALNLAWVSEITCLRAGGKWYYLYVVIDLFSRKVIAWYLSSRQDVDLTVTDFRKAYAARNARQGLMFHSDRGTQYTAFAFRSLLDSLNVV